MKISKLFILLYTLSTIGIYSQTVVWKTETQDTISAKNFDSLNAVYMDYNFITDDNQLVLVGHIDFGGVPIFNSYSPRRYPFIKVFNTSTGQEEKNNFFGISHECIKRTIDTNYCFIGDSLDSASIYNIDNWVMVQDTTFDTLNITYQNSIKTIKVGKEYWFICGSMYTSNPYGAPAPYLVRMDEQFNIIEKIDKINPYTQVSTNPTSLISLSNAVFYDENQKHFICFRPSIIKKYDSTFNIIEQMEDDFEAGNDVPYIYSSVNTELSGERLDNGNYIIWYVHSYLSSNAKYGYRFVSHRLYDSELNLIMERKRIRDDQKGYCDSGIVKAPLEIKQNPNTGGYFIYAYSNTGLLIEEYASNGDSIRTIYFDVGSVFPESNITNQMLYRDGKFTFVGLNKEVENENETADSVHFTVYLVETDDDGNVVWQYKVPTTYTGSRPEVILGEDANTYYISGVNVTGDPKFKSYELGYNNYNFIVMKIDHNSSIAEDNQFSDLMIAPNPVSSTFTVDYTLEKSGLISITITDLLGKQVSEEYNNYVEAGTFTKTINIEDLLPGVYYINILHNGKITVKKIIKN